MIREKRFCKTFFVLALSLALQNLLTYQQEDKNKREEKWGFNTEIKPGAGDVTNTHAVKEG